MKGRDTRKGPDMYRKLTPRQLDELRERNRRNQWAVKQAMSQGDNIVFPSARDIINGADGIDE